jgi:hypothetical protein
MSKKQSKKNTPVKAVQAKAKTNSAPVPEKKRGRAKQAAQETSETPAPSSPTQETMPSATDQAPSQTQETMSSPSDQAPSQTDETSTLTSTVQKVPTSPNTAPPDSRLPPVGTVIQKRDRHGRVRCECVVEATGIRYNGQLYSSLSGAAMAAAKDLGLTNKTQNGFTFWGLTKPPRRSTDPLTSLDRTWERYHIMATAVVKAGTTDENRSQVAAAIGKHAQAIASLQEAIA